MHVYAYDNSGLDEFEMGRGGGPPPEKFWHNICRTVFYNLYLKNIYNYIIVNDNQL